MLNLSLYNSTIDIWCYCLKEQNTIFCCFFEKLSKKINFCYTLTNDKKAFELKILSLFRFLFATTHSNFIVNLTQNRGSTTIDTSSSWPKDFVFTKLKQQIPWHFVYFKIVFYNVAFTFSLINMWHNLFFKNCLISWKMFFICSLFADVFFCCPICQLMTQFACKSDLFFFCCVWFDRSDCKKIVCKQGTN